MSMDSIRKRYGVPARRGGRVRYMVRAGVYREGRITSADGDRLVIVIDGDKRGHRYHPTWHMEYLPSLAEAEGGE